MEDTVTIMRIGAPQLLVSLFFAMALAPGVAAQEARTNGSARASVPGERRGFWFAVGVGPAILKAAGYGPSGQGIGACLDSFAGGTFSSVLRVGLSGHGCVGGGEAPFMFHASATASAELFPTADRWFLLTGVGVLYSSEFEGETATDLALQLGFGYALPLTAHFGIDLYSRIQLGVLRLADSQVILPGPYSPPPSFGRHVVVAVRASWP